MRGATINPYHAHDCTIVSIHAPHAGRDGAELRKYLADMFQSTRPMRGATRVPIRGRDFRMVSIHAPHAGRDTRRQHHHAYRCVSIHAPHAGRDISCEVPNCSDSGFNPRAPCGARPLLRTRLFRD